MKLLGREFEEITPYLDPSLEDQITSENLLVLADFFPDGELLKLELIGAHLHNTNSEWHGTYTFELQFSTGWALAEITLIKSGDEITIGGIGGQLTETSQKEINKFSLFGKSIFHYIMLMLAVLLPIFILVTVYFCIRTPIPKRKWLWVIFILIGIGSISINWTTGQLGLKLFLFRLLSVSAVASSSIAPWVLSVSVPLGAILFWIKRESFLLTEENNVSVDEDNVHKVVS